MTSATSSNPNPPRGAARLLVVATVLFLSIFLLLPIVCVFSIAFSKGIGTFAEAIAHAETLSAIRLTAVIACIAVPLNTIFGICVAWATTRFEFPGKSFLSAVLDVPFAVSPVVVGFLFALLFGAKSPLGSWLQAHHIHVLYAIPGMVLATIFVTFPYVARELIPLMRSIGAEEETAAVVLGANGWQVFRRITLPNIRWGLVYGVIVCTARSIGEFGAVSIVSGHIRGETNTIPLQVEILYNEYNQTAAFSLASLLCLFGLFALALKKFIEWHMHRDE